MTTEMIDVYTWPTPNGHKIHIMLEEVGLPYTVHAVDIRNGEQFEDDFLEISPNNKIPAIVDRDGPGGKPLALFESGAILVYLADKTGQFTGADDAARYDVMQWLMFQMGNIGPMCGQAFHFRHYAPEPIAYATDRYTNETRRLYGVMDKRLGQSDYLAGSYSIADIATFPWLRSAEKQGVDRAAFPNVERWFNAIDGRPAVQRALDVLADKVQTGPISDSAREIMFGATQYQQR